MPAVPGACEGPGRPVSGSWQIVDDLARALHGHGLLLLVAVGACLSGPHACQARSAGALDNYSQYLVKSFQAPTCCSALLTNPARKEHAQWLCVIMRKSAICKCV